MNKLWVDIPNYEGLYKISNYGEVLSLGNGGFSRYKGKEILMKPRKNRYGYLYINLSKNGVKKSYTIHRLVIKSFIPNPDNLPCVNHKDECKTNNFVGTPENNFTDGNLEYCSYKYNTNYGSCINRRCDKTRNDPKRSKQVIQYTLDGEFVKEWPSLTEIERELGWHRTGITPCINGKTKQAYGYIWKFKTIIKD